MSLVTIVGYAEITVTTGVGLDRASELYGSLKTLGLESFVSKASIDFGRGEISVSLVLPDKFANSPSEAKETLKQALKHMDRHVTNEESELGIFRKPLRIRITPPEV